MNHALNTSCGIPEAGVEGHDLNQYVCRSTRRDLVRWLVSDIGTLMIDDIRCLSTWSVQNAVFLTSVGNIESVKVSWHPDC